MKECWCPCLCGWGSDYQTINENGLCINCAEGKHEVPPHSNQIKELLAQHISIVKQYEEVLLMRSREEDTVKEVEKQCAKLNIDPKEMVEVVNRVFWVVGRLIPAPCVEVDEGDVQIAWISKRLRKSLTFYIDPERKNEVEMLFYNNSDDCSEAFAERRSSPTDNEIKKAMNWMLKEWYEQQSISSSA